MGIEGLYFVTEAESEENATIEVAVFLSGTTTRLEVVSRGRKMRYIPAWGGL